MNQELDNMLYILWAKAVGTETYDKKEWKRLEELIFQVQRIPEELNRRAEAEYLAARDRCLIGGWPKSSHD